MNWRTWPKDKPKLGSVVFILNQNAKCINEFVYDEEGDFVLTSGEIASIRTRFKWIYESEIIEDASEI